jgi:Heterokaryon incompatibility protein (HET)
MRFREWLNECDQNHSHCTKPEPTFMPTRLLNIGNPESQEIRLVLSANQGILPYAALSHCWGKSLPLSTTAATMTRFLETIPISALPQTFKDAVVVARRLGIRHLWIDSLCIVQDDEVDWFREAATMASVYGNAQITIMASRASSSEQGFLVSRAQPFVIKEERDETGQKTLLRLINGPFYDNSINLATLPRTNPLFKRAWVVQERILSRRKIMFCKDQAFWECNQLATSEDSRIRQDKSEQSVRKLSEWFDAVESFMACDITYEKDVLPAIAGIARSTAQTTGFTYCAGIWLDRLSNSLLWYPAQNTNKTKREAYVAPTFSWAASKGNVWYRAHARSHSQTQFCELISYGQSLRDGSDDPYGAISSASITLQGPALKVIRLIQRKGGDNDVVVWPTHGSKYIIPVQFDHQDTKCDSKHMIVLPLYEDESRMQALVLQRASKEPSDTRFRRIGITWCKSSDLLKMTWWGNIVKIPYSEQEEELQRFVQAVRGQKDIITLV